MPRLNFMRQILPALAVVAIVVAAILIWRGQPNRALSAPARTPATAPVTGAATIAGAGVIEPSSELIEVAAEVAGVVDRVYVTAGERVTKGAPLFSVDGRAARAAVEEASARADRAARSVAAAQTARDVARRQAALFEGAGDPRAVSRQEVVVQRGSVDQASAQLGVAQAQVREARAELATARVALDRLVVRAPRAATVLQVRTRAGQYASSAPGQGSAPDALVTLGVVDPLHVRVDIDENEIGRLRTGAGATISAKGAPGARVSAVFVRAEPLVVAKRSLTNASTERVDVRVLQVIYALPQGAEFFVGQQVDAFVPAGQPR